MNLLARLARSESAAGAAELALSAPILLALMFGSVELGNYFLQEHKLVKAVRDGARFAARQDFSAYNGCNGTPANVPTPGTAGSVYENTKLMVRKGSLDSTDDDLLPNWASGSTQFSVQMTCSTTAGATTLAGIYTPNNTGTAGMGPKVIVTVRLPYTPVATALGFNGYGMTLNATQQAAVMGL